jgi:hypothetical protein
MINQPEPLCLKDKLPKGWNKLILFAPSLKKSRTYFQNLSIRKVKFELL